MHHIRLKSILKNFHFHVSFIHLQMILHSFADFHFLDPGRRTISFHIANGSILISRCSSAHDEFVQMNLDSFSRRPFSVPVMEMISGPPPVWKWRSARLGGPPNSPLFPSCPAGQATLFPLVPQLRPAGQATLY